MKILVEFRQKNITGSRGEFGFIPKGSMRKTVGLSHKPGGRSNG
jgi:hypothetical protein